MLDGHKQRLPRYYKDKIFSKADREILSEKAWMKSVEEFEKDVYRLAKSQCNGDLKRAYELWHERNLAKHDNIRSKVQKLKLKLA